MKKDVSGLQGTPWHVERFHREEGDPRRHRSRCKHYNKEEKRCVLRGYNCYGAGHCDLYAEKPETKKEIPREQPVVSSRSASQEETISRCKYYQKEGNRCLLKFCMCVGKERCGSYCEKKRVAAQQPRSHLDKRNICDEIRHALFRAYKTNPECPDIKEVEELVKEADKIFGCGHTSMERFLPAAIEVQQKEYEGGKIILYYKICGPGTIKNIFTEREARVYYK